MQTTETKPSPSIVKSECCTYISLPLNQRPVQNVSIPLVFRPIKDNSSFEFKINHSIDLSLLKQQRAPARPALGSMKFTSDANVISSYHLPFSHKPYLISKMIIKEKFLKYLKDRESDNLKFSKEAITVISQQVSIMMYKLILSASQASRKRVNIYAKPMSDRKITLSPEISRYFLSMELYYMTSLRKRAYPQQQDTDNEDGYRPYFPTIDMKKSDLFPPDASNESLECKHQSARIFNTLKQFCIMNKNTKDKEATSFTNDVESLCNKLKNLAQPKHNQFNPHATEVFGCKNEEDQKIIARKIEPRDIFYSLQFFPESIKVLEQYLRSEYVKNI